MQEDVSRGTLIAAVVAVVVLVGTLGWYFLGGGSKPKTAEGFKGVQPPGGGGYAGAFRKPAPPR